MSFLKKTHTNITSINLDYIYILYFPSTLRTVKIMKCPTCDTDENVIKNGLRETKKGTIQRYYCKSCGTSFCNSRAPRTEYPENVILYTLEQYNKGYPVKLAKKRTSKKYQYSPPLSTIYTWINRYKDRLTFLKLRKKYNVDPSNLTTTHNFQHQQVCPFTYHHL